MQLTRPQRLPNDFLKVEWKEIDRSEVIRLFETPTQSSQDVRT